MIRHLSIDDRDFLRLAYSPHIDRAAMRGERAIALMADDLQQRAAIASGVTERDLEVIGWTPDQLALYGPEAARRAYRDSARAGARAHA